MDTIQEVSKNMTSILPVLAILVSLITVIPIILSSKKPNLREFWTFTAAFIKLGLIISMSSWILQGNTYSYKFFELFSFIGFELKVDSFGLLFAFVASILWIPTSMYSIGYMRPLKEHAQTRYFCFFALALSATIGVAFSGNLITLYIFYELLSLSTYALVTHHQDKEARIGGRKYLTYLLGTSIGFALPAIIIVYQLTGSLDFSQMGLFTGNESMITLSVLLLLFMFGFSKAGIMPFHGWLPGAMVAPTPVSALLHAVAVVKVGVFCVLRVLTGVFGVTLLSSTFLSTLVCVIAGVTVIVASLIALSQDNLKRLLAFSTVGQLSYIILGAGLASKLGVSGSMLHIAMHAFGKITLFFCAGAIYVATKKKYISQLDGIGKIMPFTMGAFIVGSLSVIGLPPTGGFISKWMMLLGALDAEMSMVMVIYLVSSFLNACYFFPIIYRAFFKALPKSSTATLTTIKEAPLFCVLPPVMTAAFSIILFFKYDVVMELIKGAL